MFIDGSFCSNCGSQGPEVCSRDANFLQIELLVGGLQGVGELLEAHVVNLIKVDAAITTSHAAVKTWKKTFQQVMLAIGCMTWIREIEISN